MSFLAAGAGLLARGVSALFGGSTKEERQAKRDARKAGRQERRADRRMDPDTDISLQTPGVTTGDVPAGGARGASPGGAAGGGMDIMAMAKKYWWAIALFVLFFTGFGKKLMGNPRRAPRRRPKPKTVIRYRTRKAPSRRK